MKNSIIKSDWIGWNNEGTCPLCGCELNESSVRKKGHSRGNGIVLECGLTYCNQCENTPECDEHWKKWWEEKWKQAEEYCEKNWEKYGVYGNVSGYYGMPSFNFGYAKTPKGLMPYLKVYPDCPRYKLQQEVNKLRTQFGKLSRSECHRQIKEAVELSRADEQYKGCVMRAINDFLKM